MKCDEAVRLIEKALADDASAVELARMEIHFAECRRCALRWQSMSATARALVAAQPQRLLSERDLSGRVMERIAHEANGPTSRPWRLRELMTSRPMQAVGAVAATILCALLLWMATPSGQVLAVLVGGQPTVGY